MGEDANPMDEVEVLHAVRNMATMCWALYAELQDQGFNPADALTLTGRWIHGAGGGKCA